MYLLNNVSPKISIFYCKNLSSKISRKVKCVKSREIIGKFADNTFKLGSNKLIQIVGLDNDCLTLF